jgi:hypothetical protein
LARKLRPACPPSAAQRLNLALAGLSLIALTAQAVPQSAAVVHATAAQPAATSLAIAGNSILNTAWFADAQHGWAGGYQGTANGATRGIDLDLGSPALGRGRHP